VTSSKPKASSTAVSKQAAVTFSPYLMRRHRERLVDWLRANGIDIDTVSFDHAIHGEGNTITYWSFELGPDGRPLVDEGPGRPAAMVERTAPCSEPAPDLTEGNGGSS
jgi:hypothetical protein